MKRLRAFSDDEDDEPQEKPVKAKGIFPFNKYLCHVLVISSYILYLILVKVVKHGIAYLQYLPLLYLVLAKKAKTSSTLESEDEMAGKMESILSFFNCYNLR